MIYTLTLNPALDYYIEVPHYKEGAVNRTVSECITCGGKGINVSIVLSRLGVENTALGFVGGFTGAELERRLETEGVKTDFLKLEEGNTRINVKLKTDTESDFNASGPDINKEDVEKLYQKLNSLNENDFLLLSGSIPSSLPCTIYSDIAKIASSKKVKLIIDAEKELLTDALAYKPFLVKPNHYELGEIFGKKLAVKEDIIDAAKKLQSMGAANVYVSMAKDGGILLCEKGVVYSSPPPRGKLVNSTGAGDSLVAGFLSEYIATNDYKKAFFKGLSAGSATAFSKDLATKDEIMELYSQF